MEKAVKLIQPFITKLNKPIKLKGKQRKFKNGNPFSKKKGTIEARENGRIGNPSFEN